MRGMDFDRLATLAPVNKSAATVAGARSQGFTPSKQIMDVLDDCPPLRPIEDFARFAVDFVNYTGLSVGRLTVIGVAEKTSGQSSGWVLRCKCGRFCTRKTKAVRLMAEGIDNPRHRMCGQCQYTVELREGFK